MWDEIRRPFRAKHINDSMFIDDLGMWRSFNGSGKNCIFDQKTKKHKMATIEKMLKL